VIPARVAGVWRGKIDTNEGPQELKLTLHQRLSKLAGTFQLTGEKALAGSVRCHVWGDRVRFECKPHNMPAGHFQVRFDGRVRENRMQGTLAVSEGGRMRERAWSSERENAELMGTWEWPSSPAAQQVRLRIEMHDDRLSAT
jgi:hypothetical protein